MRSTRSDVVEGVYAAAGYRPDGSDRVSDFRGVRVRELRLVKQLLDDQELSYN